MAGAYPVAPQVAPVVPWYPLLAQFPADSATAARLDAALRAMPGMADAPQCGRDHARCCRVPPVVTLVEAAALARSADTLLTAAQRGAVQEACRAHRAVSAHMTEEDGTARGASGGEAPADRIACPLLARTARATAAGADADADAGDTAPAADMGAPDAPDGRCMLFARRPLRCRLSDIPPSPGLPPDPGNPDDDPGERERLWVGMLERPLEDLSRRTFVALAGCEPAGDPPCFPLPEVLSGRYVQTVFHAIACLLRPTATGSGGNGGNGTNGNGGNGGTNGTGGTNRTGDDA
jgi:hypothetical protein